MKKVYLFLIFALFTVNTFASDVIPVESAQLVAKNFMSERYGKEFALSDFSLEATEVDSDGNPIYYQFKVGEKGFILISASELTIPILAYSLESNFKGNETASYLFKKYRYEIEYVKKHPETALQISKSKWSHYHVADFKPAQRKAADAGVQPLLTTLWNQDKFYNQYCPYDSEAGSSSDFRVPVGCVALNMINLMHYNRYPETGVGGVSYLSDYGRLTANFANHNYNYNNMSSKLDDNTGYQGDFAKLIFHCGISVKMNYAPDGSGSQSVDAFNAFKTNWKYSQTATFKEYNEASYPNKYPEWIEKAILPELNARRPIYYSGVSSIANVGGHAWMIDGYVYVNDTYYFHVNWGWGGSDNGFYTIDRLNTSSQGHFSNTEKVINNLVPMDTTATNKPDSSYTRVTGSSGSITDGAGDKKYAKNSYREWMIAAPNAQSYTFDFKKIKTEADHDFVIIYNGPSESEGEALRVSGDYLMTAVNDYSAAAGSYQASGDFSGKILPASLTVNADSVLVVFTSDANDTTDYGFVLDYNVAFSIPQTCDAITSINTPTSGVISDKKDNPDAAGKYRTKTKCEWRVLGTSPIGGYSFSFEKFDLKAGDYVDVLKISDNSKHELAYRFDINNIPTLEYAYFVDDSRILIRFVSDNNDEGEGFKLQYFSSSVGLDSNSTISYVNVYPNPVRNNAYVDLVLEKKDKIQIQLLDLTGKVISNELLHHTGGELRHPISVQNLPNGMYLIRIQTSDAQVTKKVIVE